MITRRTAALLAVAAGTMPAAGQKKEKKKKPKPPEITIVEVNGQREGELIAFDGKVKNTGERVAAGVLLKFDFYDSSKALLTTRKGLIDDEQLDPGEECEFRFQVDAPPRSVSFRIEAYGGNGMDIKTTLGGPFAIK